MSIEAFKRFCNREKPLYIYGAGGYGRVVKAFLEENNVKVSGFVVTDKGGASQRVMGIPILELGEISGDVSFVVGVGKNYADEITQRLSMANIEDYFLLSENLIDTIQQNTHYLTKNPIEKNFVNILLYHRVGSRESDPWNLKVTPKHFEEHIRHIAENYKVLRFEDDWAEIKEPSVVVTFDDGYLDNYEEALPILEKYHIPATMFICTGCIDTENLFWWDYLYRIFTVIKDFPKFITVDGEEIKLYNVDKEDKNELLYQVWSALKQSLPSKRDAILQKLAEGLNKEVYRAGSDRMITGEELKKLSNSPLITIGAHTVTHSRLAIESPEMQKWEFSESKRRIEEIIGDKVRVMSYPFGVRKDIAKVTPNIAKECGYEKAAVNWTGAVGNETNAFLLPRNTQRDCDGDEFARRLRGLWYMYSSEQ